MLLNPDIKEPLSGCQRHKPLERRATYAVSLYEASKLLILPSNDLL
jgi:hypothetical protein